MFSSSPAFHKKVKAEIPRALRPALYPVLIIIEGLTQQIETMDKEIARLGVNRRILCFPPPVAAPARGERVDRRGKTIWLHGEKWSKERVETYKGQHLK